ncbi:MAG: hypothetical protein ACJ75H_09630 [Thermoanaerobaculia bacterium]
MRRLLRLGIFLLVLLLIGGHIFYWYLPRERAGTPEPGSLTARLMASGEYGACLWVPYPHQNLGKLAGAIDDGPAYLAAAARVAELPPPVLPSFGPFAVPPSREIVACSDLDGDRFILVARVYPGLAAVAKAAGTLAGNPWLKGGEIRETRGRRDEVEEKVLHVAWRDGFWTVWSGAEPAAQAPQAAQATPLPESLGIFHLEAEVSDFPAGDYALQRQGANLDVTLLNGGPVPGLPAELQGGDAPVLLAVAGPAWPADAEKPLPPAAMALFDIEGGLSLGPLGRMPGLAVLNPPGERRWGLPAKGLAGILAENLPRGNAAGWNVVALDAGSLERAEALAPRVSTLVPPAGDGPGGRIILGLWVQPRPALRLVSRFRRAFERVPLVDRRQVDRWRDWETLLSPLSACGRASLTATRSPSAFLLRLEGCD